ncbi:short-chain dehydrogenase [Pedobacter changchengzhani]|uniref:Short-chain dehydrogenase n=1 Tax=Pedobacter changchengzhani TaxID=2529274 RepID=A0A4R5MHW7_9SPHI|nr:short-chain dehydrogenase [Pedobacter changchengzhani]TDG35167.1 short-chain dehydrogenase [Pedobacter changchengzhani]
MKYCILLIFAFSLAGCSKEKTDDVLLELDRVKLKENLNYDRILFYKFAKIALRANAVQDTTLKEYQLFSASSKNLLSNLNNVKVDSGQDISAIDALRMYQDYRNVKKFVKVTDEDIFPTLIESFNTLYGEKGTQNTLLSGESKVYNQNVEHAILSVATLAAKSFGPELALYECSKTQPENLKDSEEKTLLEFIRGFLFFSNNLLYLSEDGFSRNITWLEKNKQIPLPFTKAFFGWRNLSDKQANIGFHGMNCLFRGMDRLRMERKIDEERALNDFELFINDAHKLGLESELVWMVESYLYLKREKPELAVVPLGKLKNSPLLSNSEKEAIEKTIIYSKNRETGDKLNGVYDKAIISKIATKYMFSILAKIDWETLLREKGVPNTKEIFATLRKYDTIAKKVESYSESKILDDGKKTLEDKGRGLLEDAKNLLNR